MPDPWDSAGKRLLREMSQHIVVQKEFCHA